MHNHLKRMQLIIEHALGSAARRSPILLKWLLLCLGKLCENMPEIATMALQDNAVQTIAPMLTVRNCPISDPQLT